MASMFESPAFVSRERRGLRRRQRHRRIATLLLSAFTVSVLLVMFILLLTRSRVSRSTSEPCRSPSCRRFMDLLEASMDTTLDPCQDFYAYVCSRWKPEAGGRTLLEDAMLEFQNVVMNRAAAVKVPTRNQNRFQKAVMLYQSCLATGDSRTSSFRGFLDVVMGSPWPDVNTSVDPIGILLDLSFQWRCPVLFYAFYTRGASSVGKLVFLDSSAGLDFPALFAEYRSRQDHGRYICALQAELNKGSDEFPGDRDSANHTKWCTDLARFQREVLSELEPHSHESGGTAYASLNQFAAQATPAVSEERWMRVMAAHDRRGENVLSTTPVEVDKPAYLKALTNILEDKPRTEVLIFIGLTIVQVIGRFASADLASLIYNVASSAGRKHQRTFCFQIVDVALPAALGNAYLFEDERVSKVKEVADAVVASTKAKLEGATWLTAQSRDEFIERIGHAALVFEGILREANATSENFSVASTYFLENAKYLPNDVWVRFKQRYGDDVKETSGGWIEPPKLEASTNEKALRLVVPDVYMSKEVFPDAAYESVNYGTVGSLVARQVASALYLIGQTVGGGGQRRDRLTDGRSGQNGTLECLVEEFERRDNLTLREDDKSALYVTWTSLAPLFDAHQSSPGLNEYSAGYKQYSPVQLLFITLCFIGCAQRTDSDSSATGISAASLCNFPLSLFKPFAENFQCSAESPMHSVHACNEL
ncbi:neprilysin-1-like [Rhipicephalus sanguineus]|uniref:neprilysin-1-like n=1 Tax=Rhipicephalus sanguineus TaxID=34632 RepID=UPI0020C5251B|nr:neprilysin-1-like [Rhipicephalus sanguineus]